MMQQHPTRWSLAFQRRRRAVGRIQRSRRRRRQRRNGRQRRDAGLVQQTGRQCRRFKYGGGHLLGRFFDSGGGITTFIVVVVDAIVSFPLRFRREFRLPRRFDLFRRSLYERFR